MQCSSSGVNQFLFEEGHEQHLSSVSRDIYLTTMPVLGDPGEVFLLIHTNRPWSFFPSSSSSSSSTCRVLCIDPMTLRTRYSSPVLPGGQVWPGGLAIHSDGSIIVVYGRHIHKLRRSNLEIMAHCVLDLDQYNG